MLSTLLTTARTRSGAPDAHLSIVAHIVPLFQQRCRCGLRSRIVPAAAGLAGVILLSAGSVHAQDAPAAPPAAPAPPATTATPATSAAAPAAAPLTLADAIALALRAQPSLTEADAARQASYQRLKEAQANYYPTVAPNYTYTNNYTFAPVTQFVQTFDPQTGAPTGGNFVTISRGRVTDTKQGDFSATYHLLDLGTRELSNRQARQNLRASTYAEADTRQTVIANVANAYFGSLLNDALVRVNQAQVERAQNTLDVIKAQVEAGVAAQKDTLQAQADLLNAQVSLLQARNNSDLSQAQLRQAIGVIGGSKPGAVGSSPERLVLADVPAPAADAPLTVDLTVVPSQKGSATPAPSTLSTDVPTAIDQLLQVAYHSRPDILESQQNVDISRTAVRLSEVNSSIQVTADVGAGYQFVPTNGNNRQINIAATYPLFDGGLTRSQVREAQAGVVQSQARLETLRQQTAVDVEQAYRTLVQAKATLPAAEAAQRAAQVNYDAAIESRREGVGSIVDVITAQTSLVQAQINYVQAVYNFYSADAALARAVGQAERIGVATPGPAGSQTGAAATVAPSTKTPPLHAPAIPAGP